MDRLRAACTHLAAGESASDIAMILDLTAKPSPYRRRRRPWSAIRGITLHQTAVLLGERPARWYQTRDHDGTAAHFGITRRGQILYLHELTWRTPHGDDFNAHDVGIEMDGLYSGIEGDLRTCWLGGPVKRPLSPTPELVAGALEAIRWIVAEVAAYGGRVAFLHAHRQSSSARRSDPGSALWQAIAIPAMAELGLTSGPIGWATGTGYAIPEAWDPRAVGVRY